MALFCTTTSTSQVTNSDWHAVGSAAQQRPSRRARISTRQEFSSTRRLVYWTLSFWTYLVLMTIFATSTVIRPSSGHPETVQFYSASPFRSVRDDTIARSTCPACPSPAVSISPVVSPTVHLCPTHHTARNISAPPSGPHVQSLLDVVLRQEVRHHRRVVIIFILQLALHHDVLYDLRHDVLHYPRHDVLYYPRHDVLYDTRHDVLYDRQVAMRRVALFCRRDAPSCHVAAMHREALKCYLSVNEAEGHICGDIPEFPEHVNRYILFDSASLRSEGWRIYENHSLNACLTRRQQRCSRKCNYYRTLFQQQQEIHPLLGPSTTAYQAHMSQSDRTWRVDFSLLKDSTAMHVSVRGGADRAQQGKRRPATGLLHIAEIKSMATATDIYGSAALVDKTEFWEVIGCQDTLGIECQSHDAECSALFHHLLYVTAFPWI